MSKSLKLNVAKTSIALLIATSCAFSTMALAQGWGGGQGGGNPLGPLARYDADKDGKISFSEYETSQMDLFKQMDTNNDGQVTPDELAAYAKARTADMTARMGGDPDRIAKMVQRRVDMVKNADANNDGTITLDEFKTYYTAQFKALDANGDGYITPDELKAAMGPH